LAASIQATKRGLVKERKYSLIAGQVQPQRRAVGAVPQAHDGGYASGGWER